MLLLLLVVLLLLPCTSLLSFPHSFVISPELLPKLFSDPATSPYTYVLQDTVDGQKLVDEDKTKSLSLPKLPAPPPDGGLFDNLPTSMFESGSKRELLARVSKGKRFYEAMSELSRFEPLACVVETQFSTSSSTLLGGAVVLASSEMTYFVECHLSEALDVAKQSLLPLYVESDLMGSADAPVSTTETLDSRALPAAESLSPSEFKGLTLQDKLVLLLNNSPDISRVSQLPRPRYTQTKDGESAVDRALLPLLDATTRNIVSGSTPSESSDRQFAAERREQALRDGAFPLMMAWDEEKRFQDSLVADVTSEDGSGLLDKDEWYERDRLRRAESAKKNPGLDELLRGTGLE